MHETEKTLDNLPGCKTPVPKFYFSNNFKNFIALN